MSVQRRRGSTVEIWLATETTDNRGNKVRVCTVDSSPDYTVRAAAIPQRSARAEVAGQVAINVVRLIVSADLEGVDLYSRVKYLGKMWDVVTPPSHHHGTRATRHISLDIRERPS